MVFRLVSYLRKVVLNMYVLQIQNSFNLRKFMEYSALGHASQMRLDLHKTTRQEQGGTLLLCDLCQVTPLIRSLISLSQGGQDQMLSGVFPYSKKSAIINSLQALGQHLRILLIIHSISIGGRQRHWAFT